MKKLLVPTLIFVLAAAGGAYLLWQEKDTSAPVAAQQISQTVSPIILFYGDGCPHCAIVEKYVTENNIKDRVAFTEKEIYYNRQNSNELGEKAAACGMPTDSIGVPFLWDGSGCLVGDVDIINFFKQKVNE